MNCMRTKKGYIPMLVLSVPFKLSAIPTPLPQGSTSKECMLGYRAH